MDFGLDRIIEMIEARFGRRAATGLLAIVALGAASISLHAFFTYLVMPSLEVSERLWASVMTPPPNYWQLALNGLVGWLIGSAASIVFVIVTATVYLRVTKRGRKLVSEVEDLHQEVGIGLAEYRAAVEEANRLNLDTDAIELRITEKVAAAKAATPSLQSPQDTGSGKPQ